MIHGGVEINVIGADTGSNTKLEIFCLSKVSTRIRWLNGHVTCFLDEFTRQISEDEKLIVLTVFLLNLTQGERGL